MRAPPSPRSRNRAAAPTPPWSHTRISSTPNGSPARTAGRSSGPDTYVLSTVRGPRRGARSAPEEGVRPVPGPPHPAPDPVADVASRNSPQRSATSVAGTAAATRPPGAAAAALVRASGASPHTEASAPRTTRNRHRCALSGGCFDGSFSARRGILRPLPSPASPRQALARVPKTLSSTGRYRRGGGGSPEPARPAVWYQVILARSSRYPVIPESAPKGRRSLYTTKRSLPGR